MHSIKELFESMRNMVVWNSPAFFLSIACSHAIFIQSIDNKIKAYLITIKITKGERRKNKLA